MCVCENFYFQDLFVDLKSYICCIYVYCGLLLRWTKNAIVIIVVVVIVVELFLFGCKKNEENEEMENGKEKIIKVFIMCI